MNKHDLVRLVIVRDPDGVQPDDYFFTTDLTATPDAVAQRYGTRWAIEVCFRDTKQDLGGDQPQSWKRQGPSAPRRWRCGCTPPPGPGTSTLIP